MQQRVIADKLLDLSKTYAKNIAQKWYEALSTNVRTTSFRQLPKDIIMAKAESFLTNLKHLYFSENPYTEVKQIMEHTAYAEYTVSYNVPLHENIYSLILLRRHIWLYAETQAIINTSLDMWQALESINRTILLFDYAIVILAQKYVEIENRRAGKSSK
jgi:hypothetical protein